MVKNEEKNLERCLESLRPLLEEIKSELIIVDTGSEDKSVEIARRYTERIYFHAWNNHFSDMRNITIDYAQGEWFLVIDADEVLENCQPIIEFLRSKESETFNAAVLFVNNVTSDDHGAFSSLLSPRLFRKVKSFRYSGAIHNQAQFEGPIFDLKTTIRHYGYISTDKELMERKFIRTSTILKAELEKNPDNIYYWYQLSVTYGMHKDYHESIYAIEKAYEIFKKQNKPSSCLYVYNHMALIYQITGNYQKVEAVCLECLEFSQEYIDIFYYLAEAQAVLGKYIEAVESYKKYLKKVNTYHEFTVKDASVIDYSLGNQELAYYNLSRIYKHLDDYEQCVYYAELLTEAKLIRDSLGISLFSYTKLGRYEHILQAYERWQKIDGNDKEYFYAAVEEVKLHVSEAEGVSIAAVLMKLDNEYGLLNRLIIDDSKNMLSEESLARVSALSLTTLPVYCADILYYLLKHDYPVSSQLTTFKEAWLNLFFDAIAKHHDDSSEIIYRYVEKRQDLYSITEYKFCKALCRYILLLDVIDEKRYRSVLDRYIEVGAAYLNLVYNPKIIEGELVYELKNDEEVFLLYMYKGLQKKEKESSEYIRYLRWALEGFPSMKKIVELLLAEFNDMKTVSYDNGDMEIYQNQVKQTIKDLIANDRLIEAKQIIEEYKKVITNDLEIILFESEILLKTAALATVQH